MLLLAFIIDFIESIYCISINFAVFANGIAMNISI